MTAVLLVIWSWQASGPPVTATPVSATSAAMDEASFVPLPKRDGSAAPPAAEPQDRAPADDPVAQRQAAAVAGLPADDHGDRDDGAGGRARRAWAGEELQRLALLRKGQAVTVLLADGREASGTIDYLRVENGIALYVSGRLTEPEAGRFFFQKQTVPGVAGDFVGVVEFPGSGTAFRLEPGPSGGTEMVARGLDEVKCVGMTRPPPSGTSAILDLNPENAPPIQNPVYQGAVPTLESLPGAAGVLYLDFDGEYTPTWGGINAAASGLSSSTISDAWRRVAADYLPYNINVTTDRGVFDRAAEGSRQMCIFTTTDDAAPGAGGVSYIGSWNWSGNTPNWVFVLSGDSGAEAASHEVGHALKLGHDGQTNSVEYYGGHGSGEFNWAPIMGVGYGATISQWCKGEYAMANNTQDDLAVIDGNNSVNYRTDEHGSNYLAASWLEIYPGNRVTNEGLIARTTDVDAFRFSTAGGLADLTVATVMAEKQIAYEADLVGTSSAILATFSSTTSLAVRVVTNLVAGDYALRIRGAGRNNPTNGFTSYASLGYFRVTGTLAGGEQPRRFYLNENPTNGQFVGILTNSSPTDPHLYVITGGNSGTAFAVSASNGTLTVAGTNQANFEAREWIALLVTISNTANPALDERDVRVVVHINNVNEPPAFRSAGPYAVFAGTPPGLALGTLSATDPDDYTRLRYSIGAGNSNGTFGIDADAGTLFISNAVVRPANTNFTLTLRAIDGVVAGARTGTLQVVVNVLSNAAPTANGAAAYSFFGNLGSATSLTGLTGQVRWPHGPDYVTLLTAAQAPTDQADSYGGVIRAWLQVPFSGSYQFAIAGDDAAELRLSTNGVPAAAAAICSTAAWTDPREWTKYASQRSASISLQVGRVYYLEARMKEATGGDNLAIGWSNATLGVSTFSVIPGGYLAPYFIDPVPPPWQAEDVGDVGYPGLSSFYNDTFWIAGSGSDIWGTNDACQLAWMPVTGNVSVTALVTTQQATHGYAKSGVMLRESADPGARFFDVVATPSNGVAMQYRSATQGATVNGYNAMGVRVPVWVRAVRSGNTFSGFYSTNGVDWLSAGASQAIAMSTGSVAGLAVSAHDQALTNRTHFARVSVLPSAHTASDVGSPAPRGSAWYAASNDVWYLLGGGADVGGGTDRFHFVHAPMPGDCALTALVLSVENTDPAAKAGLMLRDSTASNAAYAFVFATPTNLGFQCRTNNGALAATAASTNVLPPAWVRLQRSGGVCAASWSADGTNWAALGAPRAVNLAPQALGGLAATSRDSLTNTVALFSGFRHALSERLFTWTNGPAGLWSDVPGWTNSAPPRSGGSRDFAIILAAATNSALSNDLGLASASGFALNSLSITQRAVSLGGTTLVLRSSSAGLAPVVWNTTTGSVLRTAIILAEGATFAGNSGQTLTLGGALGGTGELIKAGAHTLVLSGSNSHGATRIVQGTLQLTGAGTLGEGAVVNNGSLVFARTGRYEVAHSIQGAGGISKAGDNNGTVVLAGTNTFTGGVTITSGGFTLRNGQALGAGNKTVSMNNGSSGNSHLRLDGSLGPVDIGTNIAFYTSNAGGSIFNDAGTNTLRGSFTLSSGGGATVLVSLTGRLAIAGNLAANIAGRTLNLRGNGDGEVSGVISDGAVTTAVSVLRDGGTGTWVLSGTNTYSGATMLSAGTLLIDGVLSTGLVTVGAGTVLGGHGVMGGSVSNEGAIRPGSDSAGTLTVSNHVSFTASSRLAVRLGGYAAGMDYDRLVIGGSAALNGTLAVSFTNGLENALTNGASFTVLTAGSLTGAFANATNGARFATPLGYLVVTNAGAGVTLVYRASRAAFADWQAAYFSCTSCPPAAATNDADGDGLSNGEEWLAGTVPTNAASVFRIVALSISNDALVVTWNAASNRQYVAQGGPASVQQTDLGLVEVPPGPAWLQTNFVQGLDASNRLQFFRIRLLVP